MKTFKDLSVEELFIAPSLLSADFARLKREIDEVENTGIEILHLDIMDGHFVPNLTMGPPVISSIRKATDMVFDVHLMLTDPVDFIESFAGAGANHITFHVESNSDIRDTIKLIKKHSMSAGLTVRPKTSIEEVYPYLDDIDLVLIMTVEPGFGGQSFMPDMLPKIMNIRDKINSMNKNVHIQVDGGIVSDNISNVVNAGGNIMVAGSAVFRHKDGIGDAILLLQSCIS